MDTADVDRAIFPKLTIFAREQEVGEWRYYDTAPAM
jgi:hypothetical protein